MALSNYGELKAAIADLLDRDDLTSQIPDFIAELEARASREVKLRNRRMEATTALTFTGDETTLPTDFLEARTVVWQSTPRSRLEYLTPSNFEDTYTTDTPGIPINFTIFGETLKVGPFPNSAVGVEMRYYQRVPALVADTDTNWLLTHHPDIYKYGACIASAPHLGDDNRIQVWMGFYDRATAAVKSEDARARWNGTPIRQTIDVRTVV